MRLLFNKHELYIMSISYRYRNAKFKLNLMDLDSGENIKINKQEIYEFFSVFTWINSLWNEPRSFEYCQVISQLGGGPASWAA